MKLIFNAENKNGLTIQLEHISKVIDKTHLTVGQDFDIVLIRTLDKILRKNRIDRLSLKSVEIRGEMRSEAVSGMMLRTVAKALIYYETVSKPHIRL